MLSWLKLSHHHHSGRLRAHENTSYLPLGLLLVFVGFALSAYTANAATPYDGPEYGSVSVTGTMPGKAPTEAAVIKIPIDGQHVIATPTTVSGTCPETTLVELFKNDIFAGSTACSNDGKFSLDIDLLVGKNILIAKVYNALNQPGPNSNAVSVYYDALPTQSQPITSSIFGGSQLLLNSDAVFRGTFPGQELNIPIEILSGAPPYAINIQWGDSTNKVVSRDNNISFTAGHIYNKAGTYQINIQATDSTGRVAFLSVVAIVNGQPSVAASTTDGTSNNAALTTKLLLLWPLYTAAVAVVISFWLGEVREKHVLKARGLLAAS